MSRICGLVHSVLTTDQLETAAAMMLAPLRHSNDFSIESSLAAPAFFGRSYLRAFNFSTFLATRPEDQLMVAFCGYLRDIDRLRDEVKRDSSGIVRPENPADVFAYLLPRRGMKMLADMSGSFTFAMWDGKRKRLSIGTDRYGMRPLYYRLVNGGFAFASEIKAITAVVNDTDVDMIAWQELFGFGHPLSDRTTYARIKRLPAATVISFDNGRVSSEKYWSYGAIVIDPKLTVPDFADEAQRLLQHSIARLMNQIEKPICMLSAGFDSRRVFLELIKQNKGLTAYTCAIVPPDGSYMCDLDIARALCAEFKIPHVGIDQAPSDQQGQIARHLYRLLDFDTDQHRWIMPLIPRIPVASGVNFDGIGGDILFQDNWATEDVLDDSTDRNKLAATIERLTPHHWSAHFRGEVGFGSNVPRILEILESLPFDEHLFSTFFLINWTRRKTALFSHGLISLKVDSVLPFLDYDLVDFTFRLSPRLKQRESSAEGMLRRTHPDLMARIPSSHYPGIFTNPDKHCRPFCTPVPSGYWPKSRHATYRTAMADLLATPEIMPQLSSRARLALNAMRFSRLVGVSIPAIDKRAWPLRLLGLYAMQRRSSLHPSWGEEQLRLARAYVYDSSH